MQAPETEGMVIEARFRDHDPKKTWRRATLRRVVYPTFADPFVALIDTRTGGERSRPVSLVEVQVIGLRGGRSWCPLANTVLFDGGRVLLDARPVEEEDGQ